MANGFDTVQKSAMSRITDEYEKKAFQEVSACVKANYIDGIRVDYRATMEKLDKIDILRNIHLIEENESDVDPELVQFEKMKANVLLEKPGSEQELANYIKERPYLRKYVKWVDLQEQSRYQYIS